MHLKSEPAIAAVSDIRPSRYSCSQKDMYRQVLAQLLSEWKLKPSDINGVIVPPAPMVGPAMDIFFFEKIYEELGLRPGFSECLQSGGATYAMSVIRAVAAIELGQADSVLIVVAGKFAKVEASSNEINLRGMVDAQFEFPYGTSVSTNNSLVATAYMAAHGLKAEHLAGAAVASRKWAMLHPDAIMRPKGPITIEDVLNSPMISTPLHKLDCSVPAECGGALLVTSGKVARRINPQPAYIHGFGTANTHAHPSQAPSYVKSGAVESGAAAFRSAGITPREIQVAETYDAFTFHTLMMLEELGFCPPGKAGNLILDGHTAPGGPLPQNTYGGLLSYGHGLDASGMAMVVEGARQVMGRCGARQVSNVKHALVHTFGGMMYAHCTLVLGTES